METFPSLGIELPILLSFWATVAFAIISALAWIAYQNDWWGISEAPAVVAVVGIVLTLISLISLLIFLAPFDFKYAQHYKVSGEVIAVSNVISEGGGELSRTPVVTIAGLDRDVVINDPRAVNLEGKRVDLACTIDWNYQAADSYSCRLISIH